MLIKGLTESGETLVWTAPFFFFFFFFLRVFGVLKGFGFGFGFRVLGFGVWVLW